MRFHSPAVPWLVIRATTTRVLLALGLLVVALPPSTQAKGIEWVKVCGPSDCTKTPGRELDFERSPLIFPPWVMSGRPDPPPREAAPWLRVRVAYARSERRVSSVVVPRLGYAGGDQDGHYGFVWQRLSPAEQRTYKRLGRGLERFPAETLPGLPARETRASPAKRPRGVVEKCSTRSEADFPGGFTARRNLVVGPLALTGAGQTPSFSREYGGQKFPLLVRNGHRVTIAIPAGDATGAGLAYGPLPNGQVALGDAHRVVTFKACRRGASSGSSADGRPITFWSGGVLVASPRCVPLRIWVDDERSPRVATIRLGVRRCS